MIYKFSPYLFIGLIYFIILTGCFKSNNDNTVDKSDFNNNQRDVVLLNGKKVVFLDSYHKEYISSQITRDKVKEIFKKYNIKMEVLYLDEKNVEDEKILKTKALKIKKYIEEYNPDGIIASDDPASKYVIMPYFKDHKIPVVFVGVNWDSSIYGYPYKNATGQVEVELLNDLIYELGKYAKGTDLGIITGNTLTDRKSVEYYKNKLKINFKKIIFVDDFKQWKIKYKEIQDDVDMLIFRNYSGIKDWDNEEAHEYILSNTKIPTGSVVFNLYPFVLISFSKVREELAEYAANTMIDILNGKNPGDIPITANKKAKIYLNMTLAKKLDVKFPINLIEKATLIK